MSAPVFILISQHGTVWGEPQDFNQNGKFARLSLGVNQRTAEKLIRTLKRLAYPQAIEHRPIEVHNPPPTCRSPARSGLTARRRFRPSG